MKKQFKKIMAMTLAGTLLLTPATIALARSSATLLKQDSFTTTSKIYDASSKKTITKTFYHNNYYKNHKLFKGLDVSWWQSSDRKNTKIDWASAHEDGIDFAFIRIGARKTDSAGALYEDTTANSNITQALANNVNVGVYFFSQAKTTTEAKKEAEYTLKILDKYNWNITLPVVFDYEFSNRLKAGQLSKATMTNICKAYCQVIEDAGYTPMIYANYTMFKNHLNATTLEKSYKLWLARYSKTTTSNILTTSEAIPYADIPYKYEFWQFASTARVSGYSGNLDANYWYKNTNVKTENLGCEEQKTDSITLSWEEADDAQNYRVYRYNPDTQSYQAIANVTDTEFTDTGLSAGTTYSYKVRCYWRIGGTNYFGNYSDVAEISTKPAQVGNVRLSKRNTSNLTLSWDAVKGADEYRIYQYNADTDTYDRIATTDSSETSYKVEGLTSASEYLFKVRATRKSEDETLLGSYSPEFVTYTRPLKVPNLKVKSSVKKQATVSFSKVARADHYSIYRYDKKSNVWTYVTSLKSAPSAYADKKLVSGRTYQYRVRAYVTTDGGKVFSYYNEPVSIKVK
ncbi:Lyzozyme M1 (1,4-beta-N-acetylmuramidase), GH25 family [Lachnospiraceae bacterium XBB1006]|nr:Lyzozyme M1 (1,4-beta-N-acetylmuramidase), GH25 family [Lachnospiraceae bacterium XBB1006]